MSVGNNTVDVEFGVDYTNGRRTNVLVSVETIATDRHANSENLGFAGSHSADEVSIGDLAANRDLMRENEHHGVVAENGIAGGARFFETLSAASPLVRQRLEPNGGIGTTEQRVDVFGFTGDWIVHLAGDGRVVMDRLDKMGAHVRPRIEMEARESSARAFADDGGKRRSFGGRNEHPRKWYWGRWRNW